MRKLGIPDEFISVQALVAIATLAIDVEIGREVGTPREGDLRIAAIVEVPGRQVVRGLKPVLSTGVCGPCIE